MRGDNGGSLQSRESAKWDANALEAG